MKSKERRILDFFPTEQNNKNNFFKGTKAPQYSYRNWREL